MAEKLYKADQRYLSLGKSWPKGKIKLDFVAKIILKD